MKVLHFLPAYAPAWQFGGPILSVSRLCEGLVEQGVDVRVITTNAGLPDIPNDQLGVSQTLNGVQVIYYPVDQQGGTIRSRALVKELPVHMAWAEILHLSSIWQPLGLPVQRAAHAAGIPVLQTLRGALGPYSWRHGWWKKIPYYLLLERPLLTRATAIHCTTRQEEAELNWLNLKPPTYLLPNPLDLSHFYSEPQLGHHWRQENGISLDQPLLLVVGRFHHKKGLEILPNVLHSVSQQPWQIVFVGNDEDGSGAMLRQRLCGLGLGDRSLWFNSIPSAELCGPYNAADCLLLPSRHENFGNVVVEALACGCGVLISNKVGVSGSLLGCPGVRVSMRSTGSLSAQLKEILASQRPSDLSEQWVKEYFSQSVVSSKAKQIYHSLLTTNTCV